MKRLLSAAILSSAIWAVPLNGIVLAQPAPAPAPVEEKKQAQTDVPVRAVVLFSSGVGYFEHFGKVQGNAQAELSFKTQQINDILKSLILQDMDGGRVTTITYPSQDPVEKTLRSFQVDITGNPPLAQMLNQLRGAKVSVMVGAEKLSGTILGVEQKQKPAGDKAVVNVWVMNLLSGASIRAIELDSIIQLDLLDEQLQEELTKALEALSKARDQDKKPVTIHFAGEGERSVRLGYVVESPIWKTSYRLILSDPAPAGQAPAGAAPAGVAPGDAGVAAKPTAQLQGWAIVENQTDNDWNNVQLSLVSGRPISFIQDLYQPLYIPRPTVQPELYASLRPQTYDGGRLKDGMQYDKFAEGKQSEELYDPIVRTRVPGQAAAPNDGKGLERLRESASDMQGRGEFSKRVLEPMDAAASVASIASAAKVGELFQYTVGNVSLPRQRSAMIPIITDPVEIERVSIYNASVLPRNPLNGARVKNTTTKHLLQGPITVLDGATYAGDAKIDNLPPGQERLLSYGIDLQMTVDSTSSKTDSSIMTGKIIKGVLHLTRKNVFSQEYTAENKSDKDKTLIIEHARRGGWTLTAPDKADETTDALYRFKGNVSAGKGSKLTVTEELVSGETIAILPADLGSLTFYSRNGAIPQNVRDSLTKAIGFKQAMVDTQRQIDEKQQQVALITQEQNRIRENMRSVTQNSQYYNRLLTKLNDQETQIEKLQQETDALREKLNGQKKELDDYLTNLTIG